MRRAEIDAISAEELRIRMRSMVSGFSGIVEESGAAALAAVDDPAERLVALRWMMTGLPAFQAALFRPDPLEALIEAWVLVHQVRNSISSGPASVHSPLLTDPVLEGLDRMEVELLAVARLLGSDEGVEKLRSDTAAWAADHPLQGTLATRSPTTSELAAITANSRSGLRRTVAGLNETIDDMATRIDVYTAYLPKQARWQAEYLLHQTLGGADLGILVGEVGGLVGSVGSIAENVDQLPELLSAERQAVLDAVTGERIAALEAVHQELLGLYGFIDDERKLIFDDNVTAQRIAVMDGVAVEREAILEAVREERVAIMTDVEGIARGVVEDSLMDVVDHVFLRLTQAFLVLGVGAAILWLISGRARRRRQPSS
jgi:hypothetical protein